MVAIASFANITLILEMSSITKRLRLLLADDHVLVRSGIRALLERLENVTVIAEASDAREALHLAQLHQPDIAIMDIAMPGLNGIDGAARLRSEVPQTRVIILSMHAHEEYVLQALRAGAQGYLPKKAVTAELAAALRAVGNGQIYLSAALPDRVKKDCLSRIQEGSAELPSLTSRQREVLQLIAEGKQTKEIAFLLNVSPKTIEFHRVELMKRLHISDLAGLIRHAIRAGLVALEC